MKKIFLLLLLLSTSLHATILSDNLFSNSRSGFDVTDEQITSLENSVTELIDLNSNVVEKSFAIGEKPELKWKATGYVTSIGVTSTGKLGILGFKGTALAEIYWRKKKVTNTLINEVKEEDNVDAVLTDLSEDGIDTEVEHLMAIVKGSGKIENLDLAKTNLKQKLTEFAEMVKDTQADPTKPWYLSAVRFDLSLSITGTPVSVYTLGAALSLRVVWVPVKIKNAQPNPKNANSSSLSLMVEDLANSMAEIADGQKLEAKGLALQTVRYGLGANASGKVFFGKADGSLVFSVMMSKNPKYKVPQKVNSIGMNNDYLAIGNDTEVRKMEWKNFKKGIEKALKLSRTFIRKNVDEKKERNRKWEIYMVRAGYSMSPSKGVGLVTVGGIAQLQMFYKK